MKQFYLSAILVIAVMFSLTSCNAPYKFVTRGLRETDSSYVINKKGERIDAAEVKLNNHVLTVDGQKMDLNTLLAFKSKDMYYAVNDGDLYFGEIYGKINMLYKVVYVPTYTSNGRYGMSAMSTGSQPTRVYYLQKESSANIDKLNKGVLLDYLSGNDDALKRAQSAYAWRKAGYLGLVGTGVGAFLGFKAVFGSGIDNKPSYVPSLIVTGVSLYGYFITRMQTDRKIEQSILIYNGL